VLLLSRVALAAPAVTLLLSQPSGIYQEAADSLARELDARPGDWKIGFATPDKPLPLDVDLTVAIGTRALEAALDASGGKPVLSLLVPKLTFDRLASGKHHVSALYLDQPLTRQLKLLKLALPGLRQAGVPLGPTSRELQFSLQQAAEESGVPTRTTMVSKGLELLSTLTGLAEDSQAFLLLPDPVVAQRGTLQSLFLHTYRLRKPVMAYSAPLVESGALLAIYTLPEQAGREAARWIAESWTRGGFLLGMSRYPNLFSISVNRSVARSLDLRLPSEDVLSRQLEAMP
jgi:ABC-type uncharacterized transport system substrate-binding protein